MDGWREEGEGGGGRRDRVEGRRDGEKKCMDGEKRVKEGGREWINGEEGEGIEGRGRVW